MVAIQRAKPNTSLWLTYRRPGDYPGYVRLHMYIYIYIYHMHTCMCVYI